MAVMLENTTVCVCVGNVYYKLETKQAAKSDYLKWCLKCNELRRGHVDVIVFPDCIRCRVNRIDNEFILEQSLTIIAHYLRTEQFQIHLFNISEMLRMAVMFGTWQLASMCSDYLCHLCAKLVTAKYDSSSVVPINRVLQTLQDEKSFLRHFPNKTYLCALAIRSTFWKYQQEALVEDDLMWNEMRNGAPPAPPLQVCIYQHNFFSRNVFCAAF